MRPNPRLFVLTSDVDWASEFCIKNLTDFAASFGIRPTLFATHKSEFIQKLSECGEVEVGLHPNFLPGSTHGGDITSVINHVCDLYPQAKCFRSHCLMDGTPIVEGFRTRGIKYDSNLVMFFEDNLGPIRHATGNMRLPVFWEDDIHWSQSWNVDDYYDRFLSPGLKIISVHPIHFALNTPNNEFYQSIRHKASELSERDIERLHHEGKGVRTFVSELIGRLREAQFEFHTMHDLYEHFSVRVSVERGTNVGRTSAVTLEQYQAYWQQDEVAKQKTLQNLYSRRNATDPYATSRDSNQRELEIFAIMRALQSEQKGRLVDFGCGNGYTLLSLAKNLRGWIFEGIDFSQELIDGANVLREDANNNLQSSVAFQCGDALSHILETESNSIDVVLTERFLLNLPSKQMQQSFIQNIARTLRGGGLFLMCEGSMDGFRELNRLRSIAGLEEIAPTGTDNLSAIRFEDCDMEQFVESTGFEIVRKEGFSYFFVMSRALYPALVYPQQPEFKSKINAIACELQKQLPLIPGVGSNVLWVLRKKSA